MYTGFGGSVPPRAPPQKSQKTAQKAKKLHFLKLFGIFFQNLVGEHVIWWEVEQRSSPGP